MVIAALSGAVGAAVTGTARGSSTDSMASMGYASSNPGWVNAINSIGQPLLIVSLLLVVVGFLPRGPVLTVLALISSIGFYNFMFVHYSLLLAILSALGLVAAYVAAFLPQRVAISRERAMRSGRLWRPI